MRRILALITVCVFLVGCTKLFRFRYRFNEHYWGVYCAMSKARDPRLKPVSQKVLFPAIDMALGGRDIRGENLINGVLIPVTTKYFLNRLAGTYTIVYANALSAKSSIELRMIDELYFDLSPSGSFIMYEPYTRKMIGGVIKEVRVAASPLEMVVYMKGRVQDPYQGSHFVNISLRYHEGGLVAIIGHPILGKESQFVCFFDPLNIPEGI